MHAGRYHVPAITHASSGYKSQRRDRAEGGEKGKREETQGERRDRGGEGGKQRERGRGEQNRGETQDREGGREERMGNLLKRTEKKNREKGGRKLQRKKAGKR